LTNEAENEYLSGEEPMPSEFSSEVERGQTPSDAEAKRDEFEKNRPKYGEEGFCYNLQRNLIAVGRALIRPEIYCVVIYFILDGLTNPDFSSYTYYF
jgi:hypothetical protein